VIRAKSRERAATFKSDDLAVWSEDPYTAVLQTLWQIPIDLTLVGGKIVYQRVDS
jgi:predicted amidohydrolase YtcJ